jgi:multidrug efflux pump subunit AcrB
VGNPTILATFTVIAAILPMAFVSGMMGPYMSPMPIGASIMILSLFVALTVTLIWDIIYYKKKRSKTKDAEGLETSQLYITERPLLESSMKRRVLVE